MKNVWLFGDSYVDKHYNLSNIESWPILLENKYNVRNFAVAGSGPEHSLQKLYREVENTDSEELKNITLIFFISNITRYNFSFLPPYFQSIIRYVTFDKKDERLDAGAKKRINDVLDKKKISFIRDFFKYYHLNQEEELQFLKILGTVKVIGSRFNKVLCGSCFIPIPEYISQVDANFHIFSHTQLYKLGRHNFGFEEDKRSNHIDTPQHQVFYEQLENWLLYDSKIDFEAIKKAV